MDNQQIFQHIEKMVNEEHELMQRASSEGGLTEDERAHMRQIEIGLDQCWDLLRQRRARKHAGLNPDDVQVRDANTVEHYLQ